MIMDDQTAAAIRRGQRLIRMVSELHRLGYQQLRIMPWFHPLAWRLVIGPASIFSPRNGAWIEHTDLDGCAFYSSASENRYFDWPDATTDTARKLADRFVVRFPELCDKARGRDWAYAGWLSELLGVLERESALPFVMEDYFKPEPPDLLNLPLHCASGRRTAFVLPPPGTCETPPDDGCIETVRIMKA